LVVAAVGTIAEHFVNKNDSFFTYPTPTPYLWMSIGTILEWFVIVLQTIAAQNAPSLFVSMLGYQTIVYAFLVDKFMF